MKTGAGGANGGGPPNLCILTTGGGRNPVCTGPEDTINPVKNCADGTHYINKTGLYTLELKEWRKKATKDKTWAIFKQVFVEEYHDLVEETKVTSGDSGSHSANAIQ